PWPVRGWCGRSGGGRRPRWWRTPGSDAPVGALSGRGTRGTVPKGKQSPWGEFAMSRAATRTILLIAATAAATVVVAVTPAEAAACQVRNGAATFGTLPAAVAAAAP